MVKKTTNKKRILQQIDLPLKDKEKLRFSFDDENLTLSSYFIKVDDEDINTLTIYLPGLEGISEDYDEWCKFLHSNCNYKSDILLADPYGFRRKGVFKMSDFKSDNDDIVDSLSTSFLEKVKFIVSNPSEMSNSFIGPLRWSYDIAKIVFNNNPNTSEPLILYKRFTEILLEYLSKVDKEYKKIVIIANSTGAFLAQDIIRFNSEILNKLTTLILEQPVLFIKTGPEMPKEVHNFDFWMVSPRSDLPNFRFPFVYAGKPYNKSPRECIQENIGYFLCYSKSTNITTVPGTHGRITKDFNHILSNILKNIFKEVKLNKEVKLKDTK